MDGRRAIWLVTNAASGSNADEAVEALEACCGHHGFELAGRTRFPGDDLPDAAALDAAGIGVVAVFAGDGTVNSLLTALRGWGGAVLVLPGGTMNLLYHRLHGDRSMEQALAAAAAGETRLHRPGMIRCPQGDAYAGVLAGPGTSWGEVREAMREADMPEVAASTVHAVEETLTGEWIACAEPRLGRPEGYPLLNLTPHDDGIEIEAYHAESPEEYLEQAWALLKRNFREGPHETLGRPAAVRLAAVEGHPFGLLIDGERAPSSVEVEFRLVPCEVDLLATEIDDR
jgi:hypothetical protein